MSRKSGPDDGQNLRGLAAPGAAAPLPRGPPRCQQRHLRGAAQHLPALFVHARPPGAGGRARGYRARVPGHVPFPQAEAPEQEDPARAGGIRTRQPQPSARRREP